MAYSAKVDVDNPKYRITPAQQMFSSCAGALITSVLVTPLDVVKIRLQAQQKPMPSKCCFIYCNGLMDHCIICVNGDDKKSKSHILNQKWYKRPGQFTGTIDALIKIARHEGVSSLWSGLSPTLVLSVPATMIYFTTYEQLRCFLQDRQEVPGSIFNSQPVWFTSLFAGGLARVWAVTLVSPLELIRTKMQSKKLSYREVGVAVRELVRSQGILGLWQGLSPSLLRDVPFSAIYWASYETYKKYIFRSTELSIWHCFIGGAISGMIAGIVTLPFDVVKTLRQLEFGERELHPENLKQPSSTREILQKLYRQSGIRGIFAGIVPRIAKIAPACAIMIASYECGKKFFSRHNRKLLENT